MEANKKIKTSNEYSLEPTPDIEILPPMPIHDHTIALGTNEITEKILSQLHYILYIFTNDSQGASVAEQLRALSLNHSIISPLCLV